MRPSRTCSAINAVQLGLPGLDFLRESRIPLKVRAGLEPGCGLRSEPVQLPLASQSIDCWRCRTCWNQRSPHALLREAERVCGPRAASSSGFNPLSLWGAGARSAGSGGKFLVRRFIGLLRLKDWLALLGFELTGGRFGCYAPPFSQRRWLERFSFMEKAGDRWWPICGAVYVVRAIKRNVGVRLVMPEWRDKRAAKKALAPVTQRQNGLHAEKREQR